MILNILEKVKLIPSRILDRISPEKVPDYITRQPESISTKLPYDEFIESGRDYINLDDGLGFMWEVSPLAHEAMEKSELLENLEKIRRAIMRIQEKDAIVQLIFDSEPSSDFDVPDYYYNPETNAQRIMKERIDVLKKNSDIKINNDSPTMKRKLYLSVKIPRKSRFGIDVTNISNDVSREISEQIEEMEKLISKLSNIVKDFEDTFSNMKGKNSITPLNKNEFIMSVRKILHSSSFKKDAEKIYNKKWNKFQNISD